MKDQGLAGAVRRLPDKTMEGREARGGANFSVLGVSLFCYATLAACGGGGNVGVVQFTTSFSELAGGGSPFNGTIETPSQVVSAEIMVNSAGGSASLALGTPISESAAARIGYSDGVPSSFELRGQGVNANIPRQDIEAEIMDPNDVGYEYQTFGYWTVEPSATSLPSWSAVSYGRRTEAANLPNTRATYRARSVGLLVDNGNAFSTASNIDISTADYANMTVSSTGTMKTENMPDGTSGGPETPDANLDFTGTGAVTGSGFEASISDGGSRTGKTVGWFYGPNAEEVGGTFNLGSADSRHIGAFGGEKQ